MLAGFGRRFVGHVLIDLPLGFLAAVAGSIALALSAAVATGSSLDTATARTVAQAGAVLGWTAYFWWGNHSGATVGKRALGLRLVRTTTGRPPGLGRALIRVIGAQVSLSFIGMGYWNALWDRERQTWHDQMADTVVVRVGTGAAPAAGEAAPGVPAPGTLRTPEDRPPRGFARLSPTERVVAGLVMATVIITGLVALAHHGTGRDVAVTPKHWPTSSANPTGAAPPSVHLPPVHVTPVPVTVTVAVPAAPHRAPVAPAAPAPPPPRATATRPVVATVGQVVVIKKYGAGLRAQPTTDAELLDGIPCGTVLDVIAQQPGWYHVLLSTPVSRRDTLLWDGWVGGVRVRPLTDAPSDDCRDAVTFPPGIEVVTGVPTGCLSLRTQPARTAPLVRRANPIASTVEDVCVQNGTHYWVVGGPVEVDGEDWLEVGADGIGRGWALADYLTPVTR